MEALKVDLVFKGGGGKGNVYIGALRALASRAHSASRCVGTSAGAITAALLAAGFTPDQIEAMTQEKDQHGHSVMAGFLDAPVWRRPYYLAEDFGLHPGDAAASWLKAKLGSGTFAEWSGLDLTVIAADINDHEELALNKRTAPEMPVYMAVRASMSIPGVFVPVRWQAAWGRYQGREKGGNQLVDGGCLSNFPLRLLVETDPDIRAVMGPLGWTGSPAVGLYLGDEGRTPVIGNLTEFLVGLLNTMQTAQDTTEIREHAGEICKLDTCGIGTLEFSVPPTALAAANVKSFAAMTAHLAGRGL